VVKYRKIPPAAAANQIAENARIPPAADLQKNKYMLFTGCEVRMRKTVPEVLKTARARRARDVFKTEGTVFLIRTDAAGK
jgi:hypothetical protein